MWCSTNITRAVVRRLIATPSCSFSATASKAGGALSINDTAEGREYTHPKIGDREIVGWGAWGHECYMDRPDFPYPAIRWKEPQAPGIPALREKELADWKAMTVDEKKALYRASFCQTYAEFEANNQGAWKYILGGMLICFSCSLVLWFFCKLYVYNPVPDSLGTEEGKLKTLKWAIAIRKDPIDGISSRWDYEKDEWKDPSLSARIARHFAKKD